MTECESCKIFEILMKWNTNHVPCYLMKKIIFIVVSFISISRYVLIIIQNKDVYAGSL